MSPSDTFLLDVYGLRHRAEQGQLHDGEWVLDSTVMAQPEADRLPMVEVLASWKACRDWTFPFDWCRTTWPTLADAQAYAAYLAAKADTNPERGEEARLFAAFVEALPAAWAHGREGGEV